MFGIDDKIATWEVKQFDKEQMIKYEMKRHL